MLSHQLNLSLPLHAEPELPLGNYRTSSDLVRSTAEPRRKALPRARSEARTHGTAFGKSQS